MAFSYPIKPNAIDSHQSSPYWLAVVVPFAFADTYNRNDTTPGSIDQAIIESPVKEDDMILIDDDCISWSVSSSKVSPVSQLEMRLIYTGTNYSVKLKAEDWIVFWAFNNYEDYIKVKALVKQKKRANHFDYAPKFVGRVETSMKEKSVDSTGQVSVHFTVNCIGFSELNANIYYNSAIAFNDKSISQSWANFGNPDNQLTGIAYVNASEAVPKLFKICLGLGPGTMSKGIDLSTLGGNALPEIAGSDLQISPNDAFQVPETIAKLLMDPADPKLKNSFHSYADLVKMIIGIQSYNDGIGFNSIQDVLGFLQTALTDLKTAINPSTSGPKYLGFIPASLNEDSPGIFTCSTKLSGEFAAQALNFNNTPVWSILKTYVNEPINEIFTCMRVGPDGYVMPTIVVRQIPFSTKEFINSGNTGTAFLSLPRWVIDPSLVLQYRCGPSNVMRYNYVQITGIDQLRQGSPTQQSSNYEQSLPISDPADIRRAGLRAKIQTVGASFSPTGMASDMPGRRWNKLMADILFGGHLKYTGTVILKGIQEPICEGDNCVFDNTIYHIERVVHQGQIDVSGKKEFNTILQLTNGIDIESDSSNTIVYPKDRPEDFVSVNLES